MKWIHITHLRTVAKLSGPVAALSLYTWTRSGGAPYAQPAHRYPVELGAQEALAERVGVSSRTMRRHRAEMLEALVEVRPGHYTPSASWPDPWHDGPKDKQGRPLYVKITDKAVDEMVSLAKHAPAQTAHAALRLACALVVEMRLARLRGKTYATAHNGQRYGSKYRSPVDVAGLTDKTAAKAFALLASRGLIVLEKGKGRRVSSTRGHLAALPSVENYCGKPGENARQAGQGSEVAPDKLTTPKPFGFIQLERTEPSRACASDGEHDGMDTQPENKIEEIAKAIANAVPGMDVGGARHVAKYCASVEEAEEWVADEIHHITSRDNPAGTFISLARRGLSRPGRPSGFGSVAKRRPPKPRKLTEEERRELERRNAERDRRLDEQMKQRDEERRRVELEHQERAETIRKLAAEADTLESLERVDAMARTLARDQGRWYRGTAAGKVIAQGIAPRLESLRREERTRQRLNNRARAGELLARLRASDA